MAPTLRPYQLAALEATYEAFAAGQNRLLWKMPTGCGKTVVFATLPQRFALFLRQFDKQDRRMLVIAHREELLDQAAEKIHWANPTLSIGIEQGDRRASSYNDVVVASIQTLAARQFTRLDRLLQTRPFRIVVVDEAHHAAAATYRTALTRLGFLPPADATTEENLEAATYDDAAKMATALAGWDAVAPKDRVLVGVTATPNRTDAIGLGAVFQTIAYSYGLKQAIDDGWLVEPVPWYIETDTSLDKVRLTAGEFNQKDLAETVNTDLRNRLGVAAWREHAEGLQTLAFTVDVAHAHAAAKAFTDAGVEAKALSGETPRDERQGILQAFRTGRLQVITNCMVLTEGTDLPMCACILHMKPTKSPTLYTQMTGRGLRLHPGKKDCVVIDLVDVAKKHSLQAAPVLYGLPPGLKAQGKTLKQLDEGLKEILKEHPHLNVSALGHLSLEELQARIRSARVNVWEVFEMGEYGKGLTLNWHRVGDQSFRMDYPWQETREVLTVEPDLLDQFAVKTALLEGEPAVIAAGITTAQAALQLAEAFIRQHRTSVGAMSRRDAAWRAVPASGKQLAMLRWMRVPVPMGCTKGEASDLITRAKLRRRA